MFKKILFATTASPTCDHAAKVAFDLSRKYESELHLFHVFGIPTRGASPFVIDVRTGQEEVPDEDYTAWVREEMETTYAARLEGMPKVLIDCSVGQPATEILRKAWKEKVDLIVMGAHTCEEDAGAYRFKPIVGSTMQRVARRALCPVLIVSTPCATCLWECSSIMLSTDFSKAAMAAFDFACRTAKHIGCRLFLFHAVNPSAGPREAAGLQVHQQDVAGARRRMRELYVPQMEGFDNFEIGAAEGVPHVEILKFAAAKGASLIVMAHHTHETDPHKALLHSTVDQVALHSACPVVSVNRAGPAGRSGASPPHNEAEAVHE